MRNSSNHKRITVFMLLTALVLLAALSVIAATGLAAELDRLNVSYSPMPLNAPSIVANKLDIVDKAFKSEGIDIKYHTFLAGSEMTEAFAAKSLDIASVMGATSAIVARSAGVDIRIIAAYSMSPKAFAIVVPYDSPVKSLADLKGKRVAGPKGSAVHQLLAKALQSAKMDMSSVEFINMLVPDAAAALTAKHLDAALLVEPTLTKLVDAKKVRVIKDGTGLIGGLTVIAARGDLVTGNKSVLRRYLKAHEQSVRYLTTNPQETVAAVASETKLTPEQVKLLLSRYDFNPALRKEVLDELQDCIDFMYEVGMTKKKIALNDILATGL